SSILAACAFSAAVLSGNGVPLQAQTSVGIRADSARRFTEADVRFMQGMIGHHAQALAMTSLVPTHSMRRDLRLLAERIEASQHDEITMMQRWLKDRGQEAPAAGAPHDHHDMSEVHALMPGMLTAAELARLTAATGADFEKQFLFFMIRHHEGALTMVKQLLSSQGAAQEPEIFRFVSDVDADQSAEIKRMRTMQSSTRK
ncbi:MAG: DUF305 domain-containing protein, partial [bacterium]